MRARASRAARVNGANPFSIFAPIDFVPSAVDGQLISHDSVRAAAAAGFPDTGGAGCVSQDTVEIIPRPSQTRARPGPNRVSFRRRRGAGERDRRNAHTSGARTFRVQITFFISRLQRRVVVYGPKTICRFGADETPTSSSPNGSSETVRIERYF